MCFYYPLISSVYYKLTLRNAPSVVNRSVTQSPLIVILISILMAHQIFPTELVRKISVSDDDELVVYLRGLQLNPNTVCPLPPSKIFGKQGQHRSAGRLHAFETGMPCITEEHMLFLKLDSANYFSPHFSDDKEYLRWKDEKCLMFYEVRALFRGFATSLYILTHVTRTAQPRMPREDVRHDAPPDTPDGHEHGPAMPRQAEEVREGRGAVQARAGGAGKVDRRGERIQ